MSTPTSVPTAWVPIPLNPASTPGTPTASPIPITPLPTLEPIAPISESDWVRGPADAPITLLLYSDFDCSTCADLAAVLSDLLAMHPDDIRLVFRDFPLLTIREKASLAAQAAASAGEQGKFWEMHDLLFARYDEWAALTPEQFTSWLGRNATGAGVQAAQLLDDLRSRRFEPVVADAYNQAVASGIPGTPFLFFNRDLFLLPPTIENLEANVRLSLLTARQFAAPPPMTLDPDTDYYARLRLNVGEVIIDLFEDSAPQAVNSFVYLAESGWYDDTPAFRVVRGQYVELGDPSGTGFGAPGFLVRSGGLPGACVRPTGHRRGGDRRPIDEWQPVLRLPDGAPDVRRCAHGPRPGGLRPRLVRRAAGPRSPHRSADRTAGCHS